MKQIRNLPVLFIGLTVIFFSSCRSANEKTQSESPENSPTASEQAAANVWPSRMQGMAESVKRLIPFVYDKKAFFEPANNAKIKADLKNLAGSVHQISPNMGEKFLGPDPILSYSLNQLKADADRASDAFAVGQLDYSRSVVKSVMNHCFRCHTLTDVGSKANWDLSSFRNLNLAPVEKADLLVATRNYKEAETYLEKILKDPDFARNYAFDFESALRKYLALMIRISQDPKVILNQIEGLSERKEIPFYIQEQIRSWKTSLQEWTRERSLKRSEKSLYRQIQNRIRRAHELQQFAKDHAGDVEFLRATTLLHEYLKQTKDPGKLVDAYYYLGESYEVLDELGAWNLHEAYYEACVRVAPKTKRARSCFQRLQSSIYMGYSGSAGTHVPAAERQRLDALKQLL